MAESGTTEIDNARQQAVVRQKILQAGVSIVERVIGGKGGMRTWHLIHPTRNAWRWRGFC
jgi:hypothetical protein